jgi:stalled ribosome alternative rescue factor ArfA
MRKKRPRPAKPPRNPHARALAGGLFRQKVERRKGEYRRRPKHRRPAEEADAGS